jgi:acyl-CoA synthetase (AMP-forming)/AMP-acid ligase II
MTAARPQSWKELMFAFQHDERPWLIVPEDPVESDAHRAVSRAQLARDVANIAAALRSRGEQRGSRIVVVADSDVECCTLLVAVISAGLVAVPISPQTRAPKTGTRSWLEGVVDDCGARIVVTSAAVIREGGLGFVPNGLAVLTYEEMRAAGGNLHMLPDVVPADLAVMQYTSGTTQRPRGVELTHQNVFANIDGIHERIRLTENDKALCWLPLFHDMGLIGTLLSSTWWRVAMVLMKPASFALRPESWLWAISRFKVASCAGPNSAYHLCATRLTDERLVGLDLSSWRYAFNGSELVQPATIRLFCERFGRYGFRSETMYPVYGLAENAVAATLPIAGSPPRIDWVDRERLQSDGIAVVSDERGRGVVCVGRAMVGHELQIVSPNSGAQLPERHVGEIELRGPSAMRGYHAAPAETQSAVRQDGWLRTGDLGYVSAGDLYVVGRAKETIKARGQTFYASDVAAIAGRVEGTLRGRVAAFGIPDDRAGSESLVLLVETKVGDEAGREAVERCVELAVQREAGIRPSVVMLVGPGTIPRTSSGKIQHARARASFLEWKAAPSEL